MDAAGEADRKRTLARKLEPYLTSDRLAPYRLAVGGDEVVALAFYEWNIELSGAAYEALHIIEVALRNAIDARLRV